MLKMTRGKYILDNLSKKVDTVDLTLIGNEIISDIIDRTQSGKDYNNSNFKPYTRLYAQAKQKEFGTATVNLTRTQKMLNSITYKEIRKGLRFYFNASEQSRKAYHNQITNNRKFFGLSSDNIEKIRKIISKQITK